MGRAQPLVMEHVRTLEEAGAVASGKGPVFLAVGMFDGVHLGHQSVLDAARRLSRLRGGMVAVLTFWPHPSWLFTPEAPKLMILNPYQKRFKLATNGVDLMIELNFDADFASLDAEAFIPMLKKHLPELKQIFVGENFRYGAQRAGDITSLIEQASAEQIQVFSGNRVRAGGEAISSTRIRSQISRGDIAAANQLLGYTYVCGGEVIPGKQNGRKIGFPTMNLVWNPDLKPRYGVYQVEVEKSGADADGARMPSVANYGLRPTVCDLKEPLLEVHVLDRDPHVTPGDPLRVYWHDFIRPEMKFDGFDSLKSQIAQDVNSARKQFGLDE